MLNLKHHNKMNYRNYGTSKEMKKKTLLGAVLSVLRDWSGTECIEAWLVWLSRAALSVSGHYKGMVSCMTEN